MLAPGATASKFHKEDLTVEQMKCLCVDTELNTWVIDFYLTLLEAYLQSFETHSISTPGIVIYRLDFIALLTSTPNRVINVERVAKGYMKVNIFIGVSKLFIPCNPTGHWVWIEVLLDEHVLLYHDSLQTVNNDDFRFFTEAVLTYLRRSATLWGVPLNRLWQRRIVTKEPKQNNGTDCGVFTCMGIDFASAGLSLAHVNAANMPLFR
jgi:Ulp1 family protease